MTCGVAAPNHAEIRHKAIIGAVARLYGAATT
jgi:hypothetical protein